MALIIKELIVRGIVTNDYSQSVESPLVKEELMQYLEQMKREIERDCLEKVMVKLETKTIR
ncbi:MAG TPA: hypothetical protein DCR40_05890 [Prolixibacteraceae bacterium]|nr:hypothetical protein [Prolixibacteraceae bacterium]